MHVLIKRIGGEHKHIIENLVQLYLYDISDLDNRDLGSDGRYRFKDIEPYLRGSDAWAYLIYDGDSNHILGFALVSRKNSLLFGDIVYSIDDFFVLRKYRKQGVGKQAAFLLFQSFPGPWEVSEMQENEAAHRFWVRVIGEFTGGNFMDTTVLVDNRWRRPTQRFALDESGN